MTPIHRMRRYRVDVPASHALGAAFVFHVTEPTEPLARDYALWTLNRMRSNFRAGHLDSLPVGTTVQRAGVT